MNIPNMFGAPDDDDLDFNPAAGSKLASLFNLGKTAGKGNASLTYTAPKQPKQATSREGTIPHTSAHGASTSNKLSLIVAKEVHSFKLENGNYTASGKLGAALVGNASSRVFRLLLYKGKQHIITSATVLSNFQYTVRPNLYASFYDDGMQNWSIVFESEEDSMDFAKQLGVARFRSFNLNSETPLTQELFSGNGKELTVGETVSISVSAQSFTMDSVQVVRTEQPVAKESFEHTMSDTGWAAGLVGASAGSCRLLLLPESVEVPWITRRSGPMLIEVTCQLKTTSTRLFSELKKNAELRGGANSTPESGGEDSNVRIQGTSSKGASAHSRGSNKASIISRVARMGQATFPLEGIACNPSDSEETEEELSLAGARRPPLKARPNKIRSAAALPRHHQPSPLTSGASMTPQIPASSGIGSNMTLVHAPHRTGTDGSLLQYLSSEAQLVSMSSQNLPAIAPHSTSVSPSDPSAHISMFLSEARMHNTEVRMHLSKYGDKMDQLITKVDSLTPAASSPLVGVGLEPKALLSSIEKLVRDNQALQTEVAEKNKRLDEQNDRIFSLLSANSKFLEQNNSLFEQKQQQQKQDDQQKQMDELSSLVNHLQQEKDALTIKTSSLQTQLANVQALVQSLQKCNNDLNLELEKTQKQLQEKQAPLRDDLQMIESASHKEEISALSKALEEQEKTVSHLKQEIDRAQATYLSESNTLTDKRKSIEEEFQGKVSTLQRKLEEEQSISARYAASVHKLENECIELRKELGKSEKQIVSASSAPFSPSVDMFITEVKILMNTLFRGLSQQFIAGQQYDAALIKSSIASRIRGEGLSFVQRLETQWSQASDSQPTTPKVINEKHIDSIASFEAEGSDEVGHPEDSAKEAISLSFGETCSDNISKLESSLTSSEPDLPPIPVEVATLQPANDTHAASVPEERDVSPDPAWRQRPPPPPLFSDDDDDDDSDDFLA